jgi:hypothetical protein
MGNTSQAVVSVVEDLEEGEALFEEILEPMSRSGLVTEISEGIFSVILNQALEVIVIASLGTIKFLATKDDSGEELLEEYDQDNSLWNLSE